MHNESKDTVKMKRKDNSIVEDALVLSKTGTRISEKNRMLNSLVLGKKKSGKSNNLLTSFAKQDFEKKDCGITFIVSRKDMAYTLYAMARDAGRKKSDIIILKPSANFAIANEMIGLSEYSYEQIAEYIDYKEAIKKKKVVIIDMEYSRYRDYAIKATAMLLMQLQVDMQDVQYTLKRNHFVYIDDAHSYLPFIELLLTTGEEYNVGTMLFMQSRDEVKRNQKNNEDYISLLDNNIRNLILTSGLNTSDAEFYRKQFISSKLFPNNDENSIEKLKLFVSLNSDVIEVKECKNGWIVYSYFSMNTMMCRKSGNVIYETLDSYNYRISGTCQILTITDEYMARIQKKAIKARKEMNNEVRRQTPSLSMLEKSGFASLYDETYNYKNVSDIITQDMEKEYNVKNVIDAPQQTISNIFETDTDNKLESNEKSNNAKKEEPEKTEQKKKRKSGLPSLHYKPIDSIPEKYKAEESIVEQNELSATAKEMANNGTISENIEISDNIENMITDVTIDESVESVESIESEISNDIIQDDFDIDVLDFTFNHNDEKEREEIKTDINNIDKIYVDTSEIDTNLDIDSDLDIDMDMDIGEFSDIELSEFDTLEQADDLEQSILSGISEQIKDIEDYSIQNENTMESTTGMSENDDEIFEIGSYKKKNIDQTGLLTRYRPKRKMIVFPQATKNINERYLNDQFKKM